MADSSSPPLSQPNDQLPPCENELSRHLAHILTGVCSCPSPHTHILEIIPSSDIDTIHDPFEPLSDLFEHFPENRTISLTIRPEVFLVPLHALPIQPTNSKVRIVICAEVDRTVSWVVSCWLCNGTAQSAGAPLVLDPHSPRRYPGDSGPCNTVSRQEIRCAESGMKSGANKHVRGRLTRIQEPLRRSPICRSRKRHLLLFSHLIPGCDHELRRCSAIIISRLCVDIACSRPSSGE